MGIPLIARDKVIGLISINHTQANAYDEDDLRLALAFANQVVIALENARLYEIEVRDLERELETVSLGQLVRRREIRDEAAAGAG
jgi:GAF domain-containing protein